MMIKPTTVCITEIAKVIDSAFPNAGSGTLLGDESHDIPSPLQSYQMVPFDEVDGVIDTLSERFTTATKDLG